MAMDPTSSSSQVINGLEQYPWHDRQLKQTTKDDRGMCPSKQGLVNHRDHHLLSMLLSERHVHHLRLRLFSIYQQFSTFHHNLPPYNSSLLQFLFHTIHRLQCIVFFPLSNLRYYKGRGISVGGIRTSGGVVKL